MRDMEFRYTHTHIYVTAGMVAVSAVPVGVRLNYSCGKKEPREIVVFPNFPQPSPHFHHHYSSEHCITSVYMYTSLMLCRFTLRWP